MVVVVSHESMHAGIKDGRRLKKMALRVSNQTKMKREGRVEIQCVVWRTPDSPDWEGGCNKRSFDWFESC